MVRVFPHIRQSIHACRKTLEQARGLPRSHTNRTEWDVIGHFCKTLSSGRGGRTAVRLRIREADRRVLTTAPAHTPIPDSTIRVTTSVRKFPSFSTVSASGVSQPSVNLLSSIRSCECPISTRPSSALPSARRALATS